MLTLALTLALASDGTVPVGTTIHVQHDTSLRLDLQGTAPTGAFTRPIHRQQSQHFTVTPTDAGFAVAWTRNRHKVLEPGHAHDKDLPVVGHRYVVGTDVRRDDGTPLTISERETVQQVQLLSMLKTLRGMWTDELPVGQATQAGPMFLGLMHEAPGTARMVHGTLTIAARDPRTTTVTLDLHLEAQGLDTRGVDVHTVLRAAGLIELDTPTGWTRRFEVDGTVTVRAEGRGIRSEGAGTYRNHVVLDYQ